MHLFPWIPGHPRQLPNSRVGIQVVKVVGNGVKVVKVVVTGVQVVKGTCCLGKTELKAKEVE